jgi:8-oxo-dGTP diphosphatase
MSKHSIQVHIMKMLTNNKSLRYGQMKPLGVEGNQFSYHLNALQNEKYILKKDGEYSLTTKGIRYSTQVNFEQFFIRIQPKIVTFVVCKNKNGEYLLYKRSKLPFLEKIGFPYGKIHLGERVEEAAAREIREKTGISANVTQKGIMYLTVVDEIGEIITHMLCHIFEGKYPKGEILKNPSFGEVFWMDKKDLFEENIMPGVKEVLELAENKKSGLVFKECEFQEI